LVENQTIAKIMACQILDKANFRNQTIVISLKHKILGLQRRHTITTAKQLGGVQAHASQTRY
jgi:hypothetical protein